MDIWPDAEVAGFTHNRAAFDRSAKAPALDAAGRPRAHDSWPEESRPGRIDLTPDPFRQVRGIENQNLENLAGNLPDLTDSFVVISTLHAG
jgi:hypothetical protein